MKVWTSISVSLLLTAALTGCQTSGLSSRRTQPPPQRAAQPSPTTLAQIEQQTQATAANKDHRPEVVERPGLQQQVQPAGARPANFARFGWTDLFIATRAGNAAEVARLIDAGADIEARDIHDRTPIHIAALFGKTDVLQVLIDKGADVNSRDQWKVTPLQRAVLAEETRRWDRTEIRDILRSNGGVKKGLWTDVGLEREIR